MAFWLCTSDLAAVAAGAVATASAFAGGASPSFAAAAGQCLVQRKDVCMFICSVHDLFVMPECSAGQYLSDFTSLYVFFLGFLAT